MSKKETKIEEKKEETVEKVKFKALSQTDGKEERAKPSTLDQIWGDTGLWRYSTMDFEKYSSDLKNMVKTDLQLHATKVGIIPIDNRDMLTSRLEREFKKHVSQYEAVNAMSRKDDSAEEDDGDIPLKIKKILEEGK